MRWMALHTAQIRLRFAKSSHALHPLLLHTPASEMNWMERQLAGVSPLQNHSQLSELRNYSHSFGSNFVAEFIELRGVKARSERLELRNSRAKRKSYRTSLDSETKLHRVWFRVNSNSELKLFARKLLRFEAEIINFKAESFTEFAWTLTRNNCGIRRNFLGFKWELFKK